MGSKSRAKRELKYMKAYPKEPLQCMTLFYE